MARGLAPLLAALLLLPGCMGGVSEQPDPVSTSGLEPSWTFEVDGILAVPYTVMGPDHHLLARQRGGAGPGDMPRGALLLADFTPTEAGGAIIMGESASTSIEISPPNARTPGADSPLDAAAGTEGEGRWMSFTNVSKDHWNSSRLLVVAAADARGSTRASLWLNGTDLRVGEPVSRGDARMLPASGWNATARAVVPGTLNVVQDATTRWAFHHGGLVAYSAQMPDSTIWEDQRFWNANETWQFRQGIAVAPGQEERPAPPWANVFLTRENRWGLEISTRLTPSSPDDILVIGDLRIPPSFARDGTATFYPPAEATGKR